MILSIFRNYTGTNFLTFSDFELTKNNWNDDFSLETLSCYYETEQAEIISIHFTTYNYKEIEVSPVVYQMTETLRIEISKIANQIANLFMHYPLLSRDLDYSNLQFKFSDLIIEKFDLYENRQTLSFLFKNKKLFMDTYANLTSSDFKESTYETKRLLVLFGRDGMQLANFLKEIGIAEIVYSQDELLSIISFENELLHYQFHIHYFKQIFNDLGYVCHFLDNNTTQSVIHKSDFLRKGGKYDLSNNLSI